uniref:Uncharacterized protein n=1 Tax=Arundo donax TaxID=35708 RepID=A0A0A9B188_ARUDO
MLLILSASAHSSSASSGLMQLRIHCPSILLENF